MYSFSMQPARYGRGFASLDNGWTPEELDRIVTYCESLPAQEAQVGSRAQGEELHYGRNSHVAWVESNEGSRWIYERMQSHFLQLNAEQYGFTLTGIQILQFTKYRAMKGQKNQHYTWHIDDMGAAYNDEGRLIANQRGECRKLSGVLQLDNPFDYDGGDLHLIGGQDYTVQKKRGLFQTFHSMVRHRVTPVTKGYRRTLVAWAYGPEFT